MIGSSSSRRTLVMLGALLGPTALSQLVPLGWSQAGPRLVQAGTAVSAAADAAGPAHAGPRVTESQRRAASRAEALRVEPFHESPMYEPPAPAAPEPAEPDVEEEEQDAEPEAAPPSPTASAPPAITISSVLRGAAGVAAVIDGRIRRVGDGLGAGWTITAIDATARSVTLRHADGREQRYSMAEPAGAAPRRQ